MNRMRIILNVIFLILPVVLFGFDRVLIVPGFTISKVFEKHSKNTVWGIDLSLIFEAKNNPDHWGIHATFDWWSKTPAVN